MDNRNQKRIPLPTDGVSVVAEDHATLYLLKDGRFIPFDARE